ncbi:MAG: hypothetical protein ACJAYF_001437 [Arenicella sp.]|jgi:hypothetical protein
MNFDNAINLQAEVFRDVFEYQELPAAFTADVTPGGIQSPTFVEPAQEHAPEEYYQPKIIAESISRGASQGASVEAENLPQFRRGGFLGTPQPKNVKHEISIGVGTSDDNDQGHQLVVMYQDRKLKDHPLINSIRDKARTEVRVEYIGRVRARAAWHQSAVTPLRIGSSIGHFRVTAGTLGCFVEDQVTGNIGVLSNNHVLANMNNAALQDHIRHPAKNDGGSGTDQFAELANFVPIALNNGVNTVDCAWAELQNSAHPIDKINIYDSLGNAINSINSATPQGARGGLRVAKVGRTTGYTNGIIDVVNTNNLMVAYGRVSARFDGQIVINSLSALPFSLAGDSGSLIVSDGFDPVGLLFSGTASGGFMNSGRTYANPIQSVLDMMALQIKL